MLRIAVILAGYAIAIFAGGTLVETAFRYLLKPQDLEAIRAFRERGLAQGGKVIGWLERFLTLSFMLGGDYAAIGLVLAAKGIILYGAIQEAQQHRVAEYVLIGTMLSMSWAVFMGSILIWVFY
jgi:hypothetical protein